MLAFYRAVLYSRLPVLKVSEVKVGDAEMKLHEALKPSIKLVHSRAKLLEASFAPLSPLLDKCRSIKQAKLVTLSV